MQTKAVAKYVRIAPRKVRIVADLIRGKGVDEALSILKYTPKVASSVLSKVVASAAANAENNFDMNRSDLIVAETFVDQGPTLKRIKPRARGQAFRINKKTSHVTVVVGEKKEG
jgi:large subunit ribosomal protein L22